MLTAVQSGPSFIGPAWYPAHACNPTSAALLEARAQFGTRQGLQCSYLQCPPDVHSHP